jgi:CO/xanthine dehydrogenase FAD-binding subunit
VLDREAWTHAVVSAAIVLEMDQQIWRSARIVLGGAAPIRWRLPNVEAMLAGQRTHPNWRRKPVKRQSRAQRTLLSLTA